MKLLLKIILYIGFLWHSYIFAQELPPVTNFSTRVYEAEKQNWSISQDKEKTIYIANNKGLLTFDGASWKLYNSPNETILRSVKVIKDKVFTGSYMEFGYWEKNELEELEYTSLSKKIEKKLIEDEQFWNILSLENKIIFQSLNRIYIYDILSEDFIILDSNDLITKTYQTDDSIYFQKANKGLYKINEGGELLVSDDPVFKEDRIINVFKKDNATLILTERNGFFILSQGKVSAWKTALSSEYKNINVYNAIQLKNKNYALGTISNGFILLDKNGDFSYQINREKGLHNNTILSLFEDADENIWLGLDNGISLINEESPFTIYNDFKGNLGSIYTSVIHNGKLYLGTNQGLFFKKLDTNDEFLLIKGTKGQVWNLKVIHNTLFCGHNSGTFLIEDEVAKKISKIEGAWDFKKINDSLVLQGNYDGLYLLKKAKKEWSISNKIEGFNISSRQFEILNNQQIVVNHEYKGVYKLKVSRNFKEVLKEERDTVNKGVHSSLVMYQDKLYLSLKKGIFKYDYNKAQFEKDSVLSSIYKDDFISGKLVVVNEDLWAFTKSSIVRITPAKLSKGFEIYKIPLKYTKRNNVVGYENIMKIEKEKYLLCLSSGYMVIDTSKLPKKEFKVHLNTIKLQEKKIEKEQDQVFRNKQNNFKFEFNVAEFDKYLLPEYQYKLLGIDSKWSKWSTNYSKAYENLPAGDYTFLLRARVGKKLSVNEARYSFEIEKPWYLSNLMIVVYITSILIFSVMMHIIYRRYYKKQQKRIVEETQKELKLAQVENEKEIIRIRNEKLRQEFKDKSKELASSLMNVVKKNELLTTIKKEVETVNDKKLKPVVDLIDKNLKNNDDWEFFQEAFNNADSEFLKRLKELHDNLSPNDLRLCSYLRLNLSSKEIAPLLNISPKSVEVKRYRLRKKMDLDHEVNLIDYILEI
ncbi:triple tyrosine motif-containing protein [Tenacibaculum tangerinum]|uniref:Triple tyrosine motif-containing protein n=1 Tax=Tenacibaculum tangerinum TaxID=3038772 RepID=A0ABY8L447_9FLAO|nr:LuxR C-terminal-related transcriptional regulator [Tenacibaculum tangerinum]WGH76041.1 triple tyrosine motif-containing protein [Tenacibaculum tangerinum]